MRASRVFDLQNKNWRWKSAPTTMTRESNKTRVLSCHGDSFLVHGRVSFMERIQVERDCGDWGVNVGKMSFSRTRSSQDFLLFTCSVRPWSLRDPLNSCNLAVRRVGTNFNQQTGRHRYCHIASRLHDRWNSREVASYCMKSPKDTMRACSFKHGNTRSHAKGKIIK